MTTSTRPSRDGDRSAARRAAAWAHHPDLGGDPDAFIAMFTAIDARYAVGDRDVPAVVVRHARWRRVTTVVASVVRCLAPKRGRYVQI